MTTWWCAIDKRWTSYEELKRRGVVAQGWPRMGDLRALLPLVPDQRQAFLAAIQKLGDLHYSTYPPWIEKDRELRRAPTVLWNLLGLQAGDLVVGLEGTDIRGICQMPASGAASYAFDGNFHYAQTVGRGCDWVDWNSAELDVDLNAPAQGVLGIKQLRNHSEALAHAWREQDRP